MRSGAPGSESRGIGGIQRRLDEKYGKRYPFLESTMGGLAFLGSVRLCTIAVITTLQLLGGRPGHERFYDYTNNLSYCSGPEEIVDMSSKKVYTLTQETVRNPWDNIPYEIRTGRLVLKLNGEYK